jgi:penicillin amidase
MTSSLAIDPASAVPAMDGTQRVAGLRQPLTIYRDAFGVAHIRAAGELDAWFGQGYVAAQDRLWQMEMDRRRAAGRWAEVAGPEGRYAGVPAVKADILARRLRLADAARVDVAHMSAGTREMFEAYSAGVNAFLDSGQPLPIEYGLTGSKPERWEPWHSVAIFKVRHVLMGPWQQKIAAGALLARIGPGAWRKLDARSPHGSATVLPPGGAIFTLIELAEREIEGAAEVLGFMNDIEAGSNSWAVHGSRTTTGKPVLCNDSHRALDVPNAYWQVNVACPEFNVVGATFAGVPGFPHFGNNGHVAWNITHTAADYQDLYIEEFDSAHPSRYRVPGGWATAERREERIAVRGGDAVETETWVTRHGPVVHGDPRSGHAIAMRYTASDQPCTAFEALRPMIGATDVPTLFETQRPWVDPVNNLVAADTSGNIGYLTRGRIPVRNTTVGRHVPVPGWVDDHEWQGDVTFERLPQAINPPEGYIATANQRVIDGDDPYIGNHFATPSRANRLVDLLGNGDTLSPEQVIAFQGDTTSTYAEAWVRLLRRQGEFMGDCEKARSMLAAWDGNLLPGSAPALLYAFFRRHVACAIFEPVVGRMVFDDIVSEASPAMARLLSTYLGSVAARVDTRFREMDPNGMPWMETLPAICAEAWESAVERYGPDPAAWRWDVDHRTGSRHPLSFAFPELAGVLDPPSARVGGDGDCLQCAGYGWSGTRDFVITGLSVYRQTVDFTQPERGSFVVPGGVSGLPGTAHYADQLEHWRTHQRIPAWMTEADVKANAVHELTLAPV